MAADQEFKESYLKYSDKIFRFLFWHSKDPYLAEDLTSEVFLRAWKDWARVKTGPLQAWLYRVARNLLIDQIRKKKDLPIESAGEISVDPNLLEQLEKDEEKQKVGTALKALPENLKSVVVLRFMENLSAKEVAQIMGISEVNVRVLQHRALLKLKEVLNGR